MLELLLYSLIGKRKLMLELLDLIQKVLYGTMSSPQDKFFVLTYYYCAPKNLKEKKL